MGVPRCLGRITDVVKIFNVVETWVWAGLGTAIRTTSPGGRYSPSEGPPSIASLLQTSEGIPRREAGPERKEQGPGVVLQERPPNVPLQDTLRSGRQLLHLPGLGHAEHPQSWANASEQAWG
eukprot:6072764-Amphidinium_carterae.1